MYRRGQQRRYRPDVAARSAARPRRHAALPAVPRALPADARPARLLPGESAGNAPAPREIPGHAVQPRTEHQGKPGRPARPATHPVDLARGGVRQQLARTRPARPHHRARSARTAPQRRLPEDAARAPARDRQASPGHPRVRPADAARRKLRLHGHRDQARQRTTDAPLLLGRQGRHPARDDPDPERRGAAFPVDERHHARDFGTFRRETGHARNRPRRRVRARTARDSRSVPAVRADARREGPFSAHAARDLQRARPDGPQLAPRPGKPRGFSWKS